MMMRRGKRRWSVESAVERLEGRVLLAVQVIAAPAAYEFWDMGYDPVLDEVGIVGYDVNGSGA